MKNRAILILKSCGLGDFIMCVPALKTLSERYPDHSLVFCTYTTAHSSLKLNYSYAKNNEDKLLPWVELARPHIIDDCVSINDVRNLHELIQVKKYLRQYKFDFSFVMTEAPRSSKSVLQKMLLASFLSYKKPEHLLFNLFSRHGSAERQSKKGLLTHHVEQNYLSVFGGKSRIDNTADVNYDVRITDASLSWAKEWISKTIGNRKVICVAPGSIQPHKQWPTSSFVKVIDIVLSKYPDVSIVVLGTKQDISLGDILISIDPQRIFSLAGQTSIMQSAAVLSISGYLLANDGGSAHLGDSVGCDVVSLVPGIQYPISIEPRNNLAYAIRHNVECAPCYSFTKCPRVHNNCMLNIPVEAVFRMIEAAFFDEVVQLQ